MANNRLSGVVSAIVFAGGVAPNFDLASELEQDGVLVVVADSGAEFALAAGFTIDVAVGDFDSIHPSVLDDLEQSGVRIERHPSAKEATDLELAIDIALREGAEKITVVGGHGGRVDQSFANAFLFASPNYAHVSMHALLDAAVVSVVHGGRETAIVGKSGEVVSLLPIHGDAHGIHTKGLEYLLSDESLVMGTTRGVSNVFSGSHATVSIRKGTLLIVQPGPELNSHLVGDLT